MTPLEIWDLPSDGKLLQERRDDPDFGERLAAALAAWRPIARVHVTGGGVTDAIVAALAARWPTTGDRDPFTAARAHAPCADIGQTSIKLATRERTWRVERDFIRAPLRDSIPLDDRDLARASTIAWLRDVLASLESNAITLALPCEIVDGVPRSCTYCWRDPDPDLVPALGVATIDVMNDAVLAARAANVSPGTLVVTIGFGVGGAIV